MPMQTPTCPKCGKSMKQGFILDHGYGAYHAGGWVDGEPTRSIWTGIKLEGREPAPMVSYRCSGCYYIENYAPPPATS